MKYFVAGKQYYEEDWLNELGHERVATIADADFLLFNGGTDVSTSFYNQKKSKFTQSPDTARDTQEKAEFEEGRKLGKAMVGVCRGLMWPTLNEVNSGNAEMPILI